MRKFVSGIAAGVTAISVVAAPASADVLISTHATVHMACSAGMCTPTAANAVLNVGDLQSMLAASGVTIKSSAVAPNITVGVALTWASASTLTLDSYRAVTVDRAISVTGPGGLAVTTNDGGAGGSLGFAVPGSARVIFWDLGSSLTINGASYVLVGDIATLAGDIAASPAGHFALANNYDASVDGVYLHSPIETPLDGVVEGLGNTIDRLAILARGPGGETAVGLFGQIDGTGAVSDLRMTRVNIRATNKRSMTYVGSMAGISDGLMSGDSVSGQVSVTHSQSILGGMVGVQRQGVITNASSSVTIAVTDYFFATTGGLVGMAGINTAPRATISNSHSSATVSINGGNGTISVGGGLVGQLIGDMTGCTADGNVTGAGDDGGLVGFADTGSTVTSSHASGYAFGMSSGGGLVGFNAGGSISRSYASGPVHAQAGGGLVGTNEGTIDQTFATGAVSGGPLGGGGLVGVNAKTISNSYATGAVSGGGVGGLAGNSSGNLGATISSTYSTGSVSGGGGGGLLGEDIPPAVTSNSYWDMTTSGITNPSQGAGNPANDPGITGLTTAQLQSGLPAGFSPSVWGSSASINGGLPYLLAVPPP